MKKSKKTLWIIFISIVGAIVFLAVMVSLLEMVSMSRKTVEELVIDYDFYPANYQTDIYENERYQELMKGTFLSYNDESWGRIVSTTRETAVKHGAEVAFMVEYVYSIIEGDTPAYNACCSSEYYQEHSKKENFTMQMLYNIMITKKSEEKVSENGKNYTKYYFAVEYQIHENNGTFRKDIGEGSRVQYFLLTDREGQLLIDDLISYRISNGSQATVDMDAIVWGGVSVLAFVVAGIIVWVVVAKKRKAKREDALKITPPSETEPVIEKIEKTEE